MKRLSPIISLVILVVCFGTAYAQQKVYTKAAPNGNPMTCFIEAKVLKVSLSGKRRSSTSPSYKAWVKLLSVSHCGSSVPRALNPGDTVEITVTNKGRLRKGESFSANAQERLRMGHQPEILVFNYGLNKRI